MLAQSPACALTAPGRMGNKTGIGNVCPRARVNGMRVRAPDDTSIIIHGDNGAPWQFPHPAGACARFGPRGIPRQGLACVPHLFQDRPDSRPILCLRLTYHHVGKHCAARTHVTRTGSSAGRHTLGRHVWDVSAEAPCAEFHKPSPRNRPVMPRAERPFRSPWQQQSHP
jgi:hypothetical protein